MTLDPSATPAPPHLPSTGAPPTTSAAAAAVASSLTPVSSTIVSSSTSGSSSVNLVLSNGTTMHLVEKTFSTASWPKNLVLDLDKSNWCEWSTCAEFFAKRQGFLPYLDGSFPCPNKVLRPEAHYIWFTNDIALQGFIEETISSADLSFVYHLSTGHEMFDTLRNQHEKRGPYTQLLLLKEYLNIFFDCSVPFTQTLAQLDELHLRITNMGPIDNDRLRTFGYIHALGNQFLHLQSTIQMQSESPNFTSRTARHLIEADDSLIQKTSASEASSRFTALTAAPARPVRQPCGNCNRTNHTTENCIHPGGKLTGKTIDEARAIQLNHRLTASQGFTQCGPAPTGHNHALVTSHSLHLSQPQTVTMNGAQYTLTPVSGSPSPSPSIPGANPSWQHDSLVYSSGDKTLVYSSPPPRDADAYGSSSHDTLAYGADHREARAYTSVHHDADPSWQPWHTAYTSRSFAYPPTLSIRFPHRFYLAHISPTVYASLANSEDLDDPDDLVLPDSSLSSPLLSSLSARSQHCNLNWDEHLPSAYLSSLCHDLCFWVSFYL
jgi:hypothetical protein